jgi:hypothetical protein
MKTLYEAANAVEAHMLRDLLEQEGITAQVQGEYLQSGIGELPAAGLVRLTVDEADFPQARALVERWDAAQPSEPTMAPPRSPSRLWVGLLLGLALGIGGTWGYLRTPVAANGIDHDGDGLLDETWTFAPSGRVLTATLDRNLDKKPDHVTHYDARGLTASAEADDDFDGVFESRMTFRDNNIETTTVDTDGDGFADLHWQHEHGVSTSAAHIHPTTGLPLRVEHLRLGQLTHADVDTDRDGRLDRRQTYTPLGEVDTTMALP